MQKIGISNGRWLSRAPAALLLFTLASLAAGCGGAGGDTGLTIGMGPGPGGRVAPGIEILTKSVPAGSVGASYAITRLAADGAEGPVTWAVVDGTLPPGMTVTSDGTLFGTPRGTGFYAFTVAASDSLSDDTQTLGVAIETFGAYVSTGLQFGDAWAGHAIEIAFSGAAGAVTASMPQNASGGTVVTIDQERGRAIYVPGQVQTSEVDDLLRLTDAQSGVAIDIRLTVRPDPLAEHIARFGTTDVWKLDFNVKVGTHPYATDWHAVLARMGLRDPDSTGAVGTPADRLCDMLARIAVLRHVNRHFLRNEDGSAGASGLAISFPYEDLHGGFATPAAGSFANGQPNAYNVMAITEHAGLGVFGSAFIDAVGNPLLEHNAPGGASGRLGVFANRIADYVIAIFDDYGSALVDQPVGASDLPALKAMLYGTGGSGARYAMLEYTIEGLAKSTGVVCAHEVGHSLGLNHTNPSTLGSIMNYTPAIHETATYHFLPSDLSALRAGLPGPGRVGSAAMKTGGTPLPEGGLVTCGGSRR